MPVITKQLLRKRAEHNEGMISTLEEITLHQEELENINEVLGVCCRKIKILYLQNNIIPKIENLHHLKELEYLNMALNNVQKIEGLHNCEFLYKLDLTINFVDLDELKSSIEHLVSRKMLTDLYMMGNPAQSNWSSFNMYVIAKLPQLTNLDGTEITRSMQIQARQKLPKLEVCGFAVDLNSFDWFRKAELAGLAETVRIAKAAKRAQEPEAVPVAASLPADCDEEVPDDANEMTENTPEARIKVAHSLKPAHIELTESRRSIRSWRSRSERRRSVRT